MAIVWPYNKNVWISLIVATIIFILIHWILSKMEKASSKQNLSFGKSVKEIGQMLLMQGMMVLNNINNAFHDDHHPMHFSHTTMAPYMEK